MTLLDIFLLIVVLAGLFTGYRKGIIAQSASLFGIVLGIILCRVFGGALATAFISAEDTEHTRVTVHLLCYLLIVIACYTGMRMISSTIRSLFSTLHLGAIDNIAGAVYKALEWIFALSLLLNALQALLPDTHICSSNDRVTKMVYDFGPAVIGSGIIQDAYHSAGHLEDALRNSIPADSDSTQVAKPIIHGAIRQVLK